MELAFVSIEFQTLLESSVDMDARFGRVVGARVRQRLMEFSAADSLAVVASLPALELRRLPGDHSARFAVNVPPKHSLVFEATELPNEASLELRDLSKLVKITILDLTESHGR